MSKTTKFSDNMVFGLDIGTRSVVGTVGYRQNDHFTVSAMKVEEHDTRAMLDGQIHDIVKVSETIKHVKNALEEETGLTLTDVCIAAAGRVLKTITVSVEMTFEQDTVIEKETIFELEQKGIEKAYDEFKKEDIVQEKYYCVGHSVVKYYMNQYPISNLLDHKAKMIGCDLIATFLPEDVVDGLYKAVELANLHVANLTLEPIAAIQVAIPEKFRMLNIALVDVGAGTSDICITKDGSVSAYGMIPIAGDSLTEVIAQYCLTDFVTAENIKCSAVDTEEVHYLDIMGLEQVITREKIMELLLPNLEQMTHLVAKRMIELNGGKPVSAVFVVGGGGKLTGYTDLLAKELGIAKERVAIRGEEVLKDIDFPSEIHKDSLLVTPIGICKNYFEQNNNFIFVTFNEKRMKLYDNNKLIFADAVVQSEYANDVLFPKRGKELNYFVNGKARIQRGEFGESAQLYINGESVDIQRKIHANDILKLIPAIPGNPAKLKIEQLPEYKENIEVLIDGKKVKLPKFALVNKKMQPPSYEIMEQDHINMQDFYTVKDILSFLDLPKDSYTKEEINVNHEKAHMNTKVYENFTVNLHIEQNADKQTSPEIVTEEEHKPDPTVITVCVNERPIKMTGKSEYIFVDIFDFYHFDLNEANGRSIVTNLNGRQAQYMEPLKSGDRIDLYWSV